MQFEFLTERELARRAGLPVSSIRSLRKQGKLLPVGTVHSGTWRIPVFLPSCLDEMTNTSGKFSAVPVSNCERPTTTTFNP